MHKCLYCYANINKDAAFKNYKLNNKKSPLLIGHVDETKDKIIDRSIKNVKRLKQNNSIENFIQPIFYYQDDCKYIQ